MTVPMTLPMSPGPDAPVPAVYASRAIFGNVARTRDLLGDDRFFSELNAGTSGGDDGGRQHHKPAPPAQDAGHLQVLHQRQPGKAAHGIEYLAAHEHRLIAEYPAEPAGPDIGAGRQVVQAEAALVEGQLQAAPDHIGIPQCLPEQL